MGLFDTIGSAVGGVVGGVAGGFGDAAGLQNKFTADPYHVNGDQFVDPNAAANKTNLAAANENRQMMQVPTAHVAGYSQTQADQARGQQQTLANALQARALGQGGPSVAELQQRRGLDAAIAAQRAQAASARGISPGMAARLASQGISQAQSQVAGDAAMLRANEQMAAQGQLGNVLSGMRGQDTQSAQFQSGQQQQTNLANLQAALQAQAQKDQMAQFYTGSGLGIDSQGFQAQQAAEMARLQAHNAAQGINAGVAAGNQQANQALVGGLLGAGGAALAG
jgi:hypothetical protein